MNPLIREAVDAVQLGWVMGVMTVLFFLFFLGWVWWAWSPANRTRLEDASKMPFSEGGDS